MTLLSGSLLNASRRSLAAVGSFDAKTRPQTCPMGRAFTERPTRACGRSRVGDKAAPGTDLKRP